MSTTEPYARPLSLTVHLLALSVLSFCIAKRGFVPSSLSWGRFCPILAFIAAWLFVVLSTIIEHGVGTVNNPATCVTTQYICLFLYSIFKGLVCCFLVERAYIVWNSSTSTVRLKSKVYYIGTVAVLCYAGFIALTIAGNGTFENFDDNGNCLVVSKEFVMIPIMTCDLLATTVMTGLFIYPLLVFHMSTKLRRTAWRALIASVVAMGATTANISAIFGMHGRQMIWLCMMACVIDLTVSASVLFWLTLGLESGENAPNQTRDPSSAMAGLTVPSIHVPEVTFDENSVSSEPNRAKWTALGLEKPEGSLLDPELGLGPGHKYKQDAEALGVAKVPGVSSTTSAGMTASTGTSTDGLDNLAPPSQPAQTLVRPSLTQKNWLSAPLLASKST